MCLILHAFSPQGYENSSSLSLKHIRHIIKARAIQDSKAMKLYWSNTISQRGNLYKDGAQFIFLIPGFLSDVPNLSLGCSLEPLKNSSGEQRGLSVQLYYRTDKEWSPYKGRFISVSTALMFTLLNRALIKSHKIYCIRYKLSSDEVEHDSKVNIFVEKML